MIKTNTIIFASLLFIFAIIYPFNSAIGADGPNVGEVPPDFALKDINGNEVTLSSFKNISRVVLFFGSCT